jgi:predicted aldo/keto reductase-like oxidoreductase
LIGHIGITTHSLDLLDRILDDGLFETIMVCFSLLEPLAREKIIPKAIEKKVGVIGMKPFSGGVIDNARLALKYVLSQPGIAIIAGVEHKRLFDENWEIFQGGYELSDEEERAIEIIRKAYDKSFCRRCEYCEPCPEDIPIRRFMNAYVNLKRIGQHTLTERRLEVIKKARDCSGCGECMTRCPYELPVPELIKETLEWVDKHVRP